MANVNVKEVSGGETQTLNDSDGFLVDTGSVSYYIVWQYIKSLLASATQTLTNKTLTTPTIADFTNATHLHTSNATGGTIARGYPLICFNQGGSPADSTTYYFGQYVRVLSETTEGRRRIYIPRTGTLTKAFIQIMNAGGTAGSAETSTLSFRYNATTDTALSSAIVNNQTAEVSTYLNNTALSVAVTQGDFFELKWVTPAWATNPTASFIYVWLWIET